MQQGAEEQVYAEARFVLRSLLMGMDPENHARLSPECVVMQPAVKTALALGVEGLKEIGYAGGGKGEEIQPQ